VVMDDTERAMWRQLGYVFIVCVLLASVFFGG